jgi:histidinol-phosphatase
MADEVLDAAIDIVHAAGELAARRFLEGSPGTKKADGSVVTAADVEVEELVREQVAARYPDDGIRGEELGATAGRSGRRWVIDPINGTSLFTARIPTFNILLTVEDEHRAVASVVGYPMSRDIFYAARGTGCWHRIEGTAPRRITVSDRTRLRGAWVSTLNLATWSEELLLALHREVMLVSSIKGACGVAAGWTGAMVIAGYPMDYHDLAPWPLLLTEAGGHVSDLHGNDVHSGDGSLLATNGHLHDQILDLIRDIPHGRDHQTLIQTHR